VAALIEAGDLRGRARTQGRPYIRQVARLALFLASDEADHISGTPVWIDGAQSLLKG
jgi:NAD(P)-dependent dehydrogenase (short-subunit alcohol dehydrogenase family)